MSGWGGIFAAAVNGGLRGMQMREDYEANKDDRAYRKELMAQRRAEMTDKAGTKADLAVASQPTGVAEIPGAGGLPASMDNRDVGQPGEPAVAAAQPSSYAAAGQSFPDRNAAQQAAQAYNAPEQTAERQAAVYNQRGMPDKAAAIQEQQMKLWEHGRKMKEAKVGDALKQFHMGDAESGMKAVKSSGLFDVDEKAGTNIAPRMLKIDGLGEVPSYDLTITDKAGTKHTVNSFDAQLKYMDFAKQVDMIGKGIDRKEKQDVARERLDAYKQNVDSQIIAREGNLAVRQLAASVAKGHGASARASEDREKHETRMERKDLLQGGKNELSELSAAEKALKTEEILIKPNDPRLLEMAARKSFLNQRRTALEEDVIDSVVKKTGPDSKLAAQQSAKSQTAKTAYGNLPAPKDQAAYEKLPSGTKYVHPKDGTVKVKN